MKRFKIVGTVLVVSGVLAGGAGLALAEQQQVESNAVWGLVEIGADQQTLRLVYEAGGCSYGDGRVLLEELPDRVRISVRHTTSQGRPCAADSRPSPLTVRLAKPLEGRFIGGEWHSGLSFGRGRVPRVVGLAPSDAVRVLGEQGYHVSTKGNATFGKVRSQRPAPGARAGRKPVTLFNTYGRR